MQFFHARRLSTLAILSSLSCCLSWAGSGLSDDPENFKIEVTGSAWLVDSSGAIQANGAPIDLVTDLGVGQQQPTFYGRLVVKPGRRHRIVVEGTPFRLSGYNTVNRSVTYRGQTFNVSQTLQSNADFNYLFAGYQFDVLTGSMGHLGFSAGGAYLDATGTIRSVQTNTLATKSETIGLPLAGAEFRIFPIPGHKLLDIDGGIRGMGVGNYGHYLEGSANAGLSLGPLTFLAGYRDVRLDLHEATGAASGVNVRLKGPIFSMQWRW